MKELDSVNYLHYGKAVELLTNIDLTPFDGKISKQKLLSSIQKSHSISGYLCTVIDEYGGRRTRQLNVSDFRYDLKRTEEKRAFFSSLRCRGFSYKLYSDITNFPYRLRRRINLRIALVADRGLFYPRMVKDYLARHRANHYFVYDSPAIAFALGMSTHNAWYIFIFQSDLVRYGPAAVREHFRGWRKVLFANIIKHAKKNVEKIYLCNEEDVLKGCHCDYPISTGVPVSWRFIYRGTASEFGMELTKLKRKLNIQLYDRKPAVYAKKMYMLDL